LLGQVVHLGLAFGLEHSLVEVEEGVGGEAHLFSGGCSRGDRSGSRGGSGSRGRSGLGSSHRSGRSRSGHAVAALDAGGRGPEVVAPAVFVAAVLPHGAVACTPVVNSGCFSLSEGRTGQQGGGKQSSYFIEFVHADPHE